MKISAVIITYNEERNIARCIQSIQNIVDEIIVLDSFSTDKTVEIANNLGALVTHRKWEGYTNAKNFANALTQYNYILSLDADEAVNEELAAAILLLKQTTSQQVYSVNRLTNYCGKWIYHSGWYPDIKVRLFPKNAVKWEGEFVHEELKFSQNIKTTLLPGHLEHFSYYTHSEHRERADKYSELTALKHFKKGKTATFLKPYFSAIGRFISMFIFKKGFLDGVMGWKIACISALSNIHKYKELRRLHRETNKH